MELRILKRAMILIWKTENNLIKACIERNNQEIDQDRLGICGGSYGGYLACRLICDPFLDFKAAYVVNPFLSLGFSFISSDVPDLFYSYAYNEQLDS